MGSRSIVIERFNGIDNVPVSVDFKFRTTSVWRFPSFAGLAVDPCIKQERVDAQHGS
tara:strand:+ start:328 stop:498 length:171 start_codon:yes stop_codon:yes gene_type:complete